MERLGRFCDRHTVCTMPVVHVRYVFESSQKSAFFSVGLLPAEVSRALVPRSVTAALALPIAEGLGAPLAVTAAAVVCTGNGLRRCQGLRVVLTDKCCCICGSEQFQFLPSDSAAKEGWVRLMLFPCSQGTPGL